LGSGFFDEFDDAVLLIDRHITLNACSSGTLRSPPQTSAARGVRGQACRNHLVDDRAGEDQHERGIAGG
jgi:hypothetical protein